MNRVYLNCIAVAISAGALLAQPAPPVPPVPPVAPAAPAPPVPPAAEARRNIGEQVREQVREQVDAARKQMEDLRIDLEPLKGMHIDIEPMLMAQKMTMDHELMHGPFRDGDRYSRGMDALDQRNYERALSDFDEYYKAMNGKKDSRAEGALYWKAYTLNKLGRRDEATATWRNWRRAIPPAVGWATPRRCNSRSARAPDKGASPEEPER